MNQLYNMLMGANPPQAPIQNGPVSPGYGAPMFTNPMQKVQYIMQALTNPAAFVRQALPDIPAEISNDPNRILQYLQQTRGISNEQIQQIASQIPR